MSSAQLWMVGVLASITFGRLLAAIAARKGAFHVAEALLDWGPSASVAAAVGGLRLLITKAQVMTDVNKINCVAFKTSHTVRTAHAKPRIITHVNKICTVESAATSYGVQNLNRFGHALLVDDIWIYALFAAVLVVTLIKVRAPSEWKSGSPNGAKEWAGYLGVVVLPSVFVGAGACIAVYLRS